MTPSLTPEVQEAARKAAKATAEKKRRAAIKIAKTQLEKAGLDADTKLTTEQRDRAAESAKTKAGLQGKALAAFILEGKGTGAQVQEARAANEAAAKTERTRANVTRSADPEATALVQEAKALAPEVKSAFLPKEGREFLTKFEQRKTGMYIIVKRTDVDGAEEVSIKRADLRKFAQDGEKNKDIRAALAGLGKDTALWGRKLGLMILATDAR